MIGEQNSLAYLSANSNQNLSAFWDSLGFSTSYTISTAIAAFAYRRYSSMENKLEQYLQKQEFTSVRLNGVSIYEDEKRMYIGYRILDTSVNGLAESLEIRNELVNIP